MDSSPCLRENLLEEAVNNMTSKSCIRGIAGKKCFIDNFASTLFLFELTLFWHANSHVSSFWLEFTSNFKYSSFSDDSVCKMDDALVIFCCRIESLEMSCGAHWISYILCFPFDKR